MKRVIVAVIILLIVLMAFALGLRAQVPPTVAKPAAGHSWALIFIGVFVSVIALSVFYACNAVAQISEAGEEDQ